MNDYVSILDNDCNFLKVNNKQTQIMGHRSNLDILGKTYHQFKGVSAFISENFIAEDKQVLKKREISDIICRSEKTIHFHLEAIKSKFDMTTKSALIEKAIYGGFMNIIPDEVF